MMHTTNAHGRHTNNEILTMRALFKPAVQAQENTEHEGGALQATPPAQHQSSHASQVCGAHNVDRLRATRDAIQQGKVRNNRDCIRLLHPHRANWGSKRKRAAKPTWGKRHGCKHNASLARQSKPNCTRS